MNRRYPTTREPMFPDITRKIANLVYYGDRTDEEILSSLGKEVDEKVVTSRWVLFMTKMARDGQDIL